MKAPLSYYTDEELTAELSARVQRRQAMSAINEKTGLIAQLLARAAHEETQGNASLAAQYRDWADREMLMRNAMCENAVKEADMSNRPETVTPAKVWKTTLRQRAFKDRMADAGMVQLNFWVPAAALADVKRAGELMRANPHLTVARLADPRSGKLVGLKEKKSCC